MASGFARAEAAGFADVCILKVTVRDVESPKTLVAQLASEYSCEGEATTYGIRDPADDLWRRVVRGLGSADTVRRLWAEFTGTDISIGRMKQMQAQPKAVPPAIIIARGKVLPRNNLAHFPTAPNGS